MRNIYRDLLGALRDGRRAALVTRYRAGGAQKTLLLEGGEDWTPPAPGEGPVRLREEDDIPVLVEHFAPKPRLLVMGGGHIALPLCEFGAKLGFSVVVYDDRPGFANAARFPDAAEVVCDSFAKIEERLRIRGSDYVVIVTRGHRHDSDCLRAVLDGEPPYYVGMIGSRRRIAIVKAQTAADYGEHPGLDALHAPIGLHIGAVTPEEIALSILAEVVRRKRLGYGDGAAPQIEATADLELFELLAAERGETLALVTVVETAGSTPREAGARMVVDYLGKAVGSIGGGCAVAGVAAQAREVIRSGEHAVMEIDMTDTAEEDGMVCGGTMRVLIEPV